MINLKDMLPHISVYPEGVYLSRSSIWFSLKPVYGTLVGGNVQFYGF